MRWSHYVAKHGPLHMGRHIEEAAARICYMLAQLGGNKTAKPEDFLPPRDSLEPDEPATIDEIAALLTGVARQNGK